MVVLFVHRGVYGLWLDGDLYRRLWWCYLSTGVCVGCGWMVTCTTGYVGVFVHRGVCGLWLDGDLYHRLCWCFCPQGCVWAVVGW